MYLSSSDKHGIAKKVEKRLEKCGFEPRWSCCMKTEKIVQAIYIKIELAASGSQATERTSRNVFVRLGAIFLLG